MKKIYKFMSVCLILICCVVIAGCSCSKPVTVTYNIATGENNLETGLTKKISIAAAVYKKYREPEDTPCYKKMKAGYVELSSGINGEDEAYRCYNNDCYKKSGDEYVLIGKDATSVGLCIDGTVTCYEKVDVTYYKLLTSPGEVYECYTADGEYFERAIHNRAEKAPLEEKTTVISTNQNMLAYSSQSETVPSQKTYSLLYEFEITNNESTDIYIEAIEHNDVTGGVIKNENAGKVKLMLPEERAFMDNKYYYRLASNSKTTIKIEVKYLLNTDLNKKSKSITLTLPIIVKA